MSINMKSVYFLLIPHMLNKTKTKKKMLSYSKEMLKIQYCASKNNFHFIISGDEVWFEHHYDSMHIWSFDIEDRNTIVNKPHKSKITKVTIVFNIDCLKQLYLKHKRFKINLDYYFKNNRKSKKLTQSMYLQIDNSSVHAANKVKTSFVGLNIYAIFMRICQITLSIKLSKNEIQACSQRIHLYYCRVRMQKVRSVTISQIG